MNTKKSLLSSTHKEDVVATITTGATGKTMLRKAIQIALAGSLLASGAASAVLLDHGPSDPILTWPSWYRDTTGMAIGLCKSTSTWCFPAAPMAGFFAGNIGPEMFYNMVEFKDNGAGSASGLQYHFLAGMEASYVPAGDPVHGTESVFARIRMSINFKDAINANGGNMEGTYTITHPFGKQTFDNVKATGKTNFTGAQASVYFTIDIPVGQPLNFDAALSSSLGPWITWDTMPNTGNPLTSGFAGPNAGERFVGDPTLVHLFTGSPTGNNFLRIEGPAGSNLDGQGNDFIQIDEANVIGQLWTQPIAQPLAINDAYMSREPLAGGKNAIDVWATSSPGQKLILTGVDGTMPSLQMFPDGTTPGKYHAHIEYPNTEIIPNTIKVTNFTSIPVVSATTGLVDGVEISQASFDTATRVITVVAESTDHVNSPALTVEGIPGVPTAPGISPAVTGRMALTPQCPLGVIAPKVCFTTTLPADKEPPASISVFSTELGSHADHLVSISGFPQNPSPAPVASNVSFSVNTTGTTPLAGLPLNALIVQQPANGNIALVAGSWIFTANSGATTGADSFQYVTQNPAPGLAVSNVATGSLTLTFNPTAPTVVNDQFATQTGVAKTLRILANDKPASTNPIDAILLGSIGVPSSIIFSTPTNSGSIATPLPLDGSVSFTAKNAGSETFNYSVTNSATPANRSANATVTLTNFARSEAVTLSSVIYTAASGKWVIKGTTTWFGPNLTQTTLTCWAGTGATATASTLIGTGLVDTAGNITFAPVNSTVVGINKATITCQTSNGGKGAAGTVVK
jgi:hypothetical protein